MKRGIFNFVVYFTTSIAVFVMPSPAHASTTAMQSDTQDSVAVVNAAKGQLDELEHAKDFQNVRNVSSKLDVIRKELLSIKSDDPQYPNSIALMDRYIRIEQAYHAKKSADEASKDAATEAKQAKHKGVSIGMTEDQVLASNWGRPRSKNVTRNVAGAFEQWTYHDGNYLYFENGILTSIQTH